LREAECESEVATH
jgi:hypothetical protein